MCNYSLICAKEATCVAFGASWYLSSSSRSRDFTQILSSKIAIRFGLKRDASAMINCLEPAWCFVLVDGELRRLSQARACLVVLSRACLDVRRGRGAACRLADQPGSDEPFYSHRTSAQCRFGPTHANSHGRKTYVNYLHFTLGSCALIICAVSAFPLAPDVPACS